MEQYLDLDQQIILEGMHKALSVYLGPLSGTGKLLIYDTNRYANNSYIERVAPYIDYLFYQSYGASPSRLDQGITGYSEYISSCQFLSGYTSPEELDGNRWEDTIGPIWESNAITMAQWQPAGGAKGGIFQYAIDRDGMTYDEPDYSSIRPTIFEYAKRVIATIKSQEFAETKTSATSTIEALPTLSQEVKAKITAKVRDAQVPERHLLSLCHWLLG